jgi:TPR repeat protein
MQHSEHEPFLEAARARKRGDVARAIEIYEGLAAEGNAHALVLLGNIYIRGGGVPVDLERAETLFTRAADLGSTEAIFQMATIWYRRGDLQRYFLAVQSAATAEPEVLIARFYLARCYLRGRGIAKDNAKALELFRAAADSGHIRAKMYLARRLLFKFYNPFSVVYGLIKLASAAFEGLVISMVNPHDERVR